MNFFDTSIDRVLGHEGKYSNDTDDPGGETNWGISKRSYPHLDIKNLTREQAIEIYRRDFWEYIHADKLFPSVAYQALDFAVNSGIHTAIRYLQRALCVADDGWWGPVTEKAAATISETDQLMLLNAERLDFMTRLKGWANFGRGWARRIAQNLRFGAVDT